MSIQPPASTADSRASTARRATSPGQPGLPVNPFQALRAVHGMLLGQADFETLAGNPRGKQMLHAAWLHGSGVVWGLPVTREGETGLRVGSGLAVDGRGRELRLEKAWCGDLAVLAEQEPDDDGWIRGCVVVTFHSCLDSPVPTLADPCDVDREHDDRSRVLETARVELIPRPCPPPGPGPYPRVRALLGTLTLAPGATASEVDRARATVLGAPRDEQAAVLWHEFRCLAARDVAERGPEPPDGPTSPDPFPTTEALAPVPLLAVRARFRRVGGCTGVEAVELDHTVRHALLPTTTITELLCGWAPGTLLGKASERDARGPRVKPETVRWRDEQTVEFGLDRPVHQGSLRDAVSVSSLGERGWVRHELDGVPRTEGDGTTVVVPLTAPGNPGRYRLVVRGTGETPAYGRGPAVPLAGVVGGPPGSADNGHDAVISRPHPDERGRDGS